MTWHTEGISVTAPVKWRQFDGLVSAFWEAESQMGAKGYYLAADPRIMIFFIPAAIACFGIACFGTRFR